MGMHWTREQFLAGATLGAGLLAGNLVPMEWFLAHPNIRWVIVSLILIGTLSMIVGAVRAKPLHLDPGEYIPALQVIEYIASESAWGVMAAHDFVMQGSRFQDIHENLMLYAREEFSRGASSLNIRSTGLLRGKREEIPFSYWHDALLDWDSIARRGVVKTAVTQYSMYKGIAIYEDVRIAKNDVLRAWPIPPEWWWS